MTPEPRFLALVAKVDEELSRIRNRLIILRQRIDSYDGNEQTNRRESKKLNKELSFLRALNGEIMRHEPDEDGYCKQCSCLYSHNIRGDEMFIHWPCKPWLDMESEVGK